MATIIQIMNADRNLSMFCKALKSSGMEEQLNELGPFTILGPVNLALKNQMSLSFDQMMEPLNLDKLLGFLSGYVLVGKKMFGDFHNNQRLPSVDGKEVLVTIQNEEIFINGSKILSRDRQGSNGVIHLLGNIYKTG